MSGLVSFELFPFLIKDYLNVINYNIPDVNQALEQNLRSTVKVGLNTR